MSSRSVTGRRYEVRHSDIDAWAALATFAADFADGQVRSLQRLRGLRDDVNRAVWLGPDGETNPCRRLLDLVNAWCDPSVEAAERHALKTAALAVLGRVSIERELLRAGRSAR